MLIIGFQNRVVHHPRDSAHLL